MILVLGSRPSGDVGAFWDDVEMLPPPRVMVFDETLGEYVEQRKVVCLARWATDGLHYRARQLCGDVAVRFIGDAGFCQHHYNRAMEWHHEMTRRDLEAEGGTHAESRDWDATGWEVVYYLRRTDGCIKIGYTVSFPRRLSQLKGEHGELQVLATHTGDRACESNKHREFAATRVDGEWFRPTPELWSWILTVRRHQPPDTLYPVTLPVADLQQFASAKKSRRKRVA